MELVSCLPRGLSETAILSATVPGTGAPAGQGRVKLAPSASEGFRAAVSAGYPRAKRSHRFTPRDEVSQPFLQPRIIYGLQPAPGPQDGRCSRRVYNAQETDQ